jgi:hypothetical protein
MGEMTENVLAALSSLGYYQQEMEKMLTRLSEQFCRKNRLALPLASVNPILADQFPQYLRCSFVVLWVSTAEISLQGLCLEVGRRNGLCKEQVKACLAGNGKIKKSKDFLKCLAGEQFANSTRVGFLQSMEKLFIPLLFFARVRNCLLHADGDISKLTKNGDKKELRNGARKGGYPGFQIVNDHIVLNEEFCRHVEKEVDCLFTHLSYLLQ